MNAGNSILFLISKNKTMKNLLLILALILCGFSFSQLPTSRAYVELNGGMAQLSDEWEGGWFPGASFLVGHQNYVTKNVFIEIQGGVAFPSIVTVKTGVGVTTEGFGFSLGVRVFPTMGYAQVHFPSKNGQLNISAEASPLTNSNYSGLSFGAKNIITIGYQWNVGKSRRK